MDSDLTQSAGAPIVRVVNSQKYEFLPLLKRDVAALAARWLAEDKAAVLRRLGELGCPSEFRFQKLDELEDRAQFISYPLAELVKYRRAAEAVHASLQKTVPGAPLSAIEDLPLDWRAIIGLAFELCGVAPDELRTGGQLFAGSKPANETNA